MAHDGGKVDWEDCIEFLKGYLQEGLSATQMAARLLVDAKKKTTRNAVLGIIHRRGLVTHESSRKSEGIRRSQALNRIRNRQARAKAPVFGFAGPKSSTIVRDPEALPEEDRKPEGCYPLIHADPEKERPADGCKWFYGDPIEDPNGFCPSKSVPGLPYCERHSRAAFRPVEARSRSSSGPTVVPFREKERV